MSEVPLYSNPGRSKEAPTTLETPKISFKMLLLGLSALLEVDLAEHTLFALVWRGWRQTLSHSKVILKIFRRK